eukprot:3791136-Pleurochrysis_carterae.AAC.1
MEDGGGAGDGGGAVLNQRDGGFGDGGGGGGAGDGGEATATLLSPRLPQSVQSLPRVQKLYSDPAPPSSQSPSPA